jgi:uncharacterized membrane protein YuzA (DUF378 family)
MKMSALDWIAAVLVIIGGLNWGLVGFFNYNLVDTIFGVASDTSRVIYAIVGLATLWMIWMMAAKKSS